MGCAYAFKEFCVRGNMLDDIYRGDGDGNLLEAF